MVSDGRDLKLLQKGNGWKMCCKYGEKHTLAQPLPIVIGTAYNLLYKSLNFRKYFGDLELIFFLSRAEQKYVLGHNAALMHR